MVTVYTESVSGYKYISTKSGVGNYFFYRAGPKGLTQFCIILIVFLYKKQ